MSGHVISDGCCIQCAVSECFSMYYNDCGKTYQDWSLKACPESTTDLRCPTPYDCQDEGKDGDLIIYIPLFISVLLIISLIAFICVKVVKRQ